jgi:hypothetical protein
LEANVLSKQRKVIFLALHIEKKNYSTFFSLHVPSYVKAEEEKNNFLFVYFKFNLASGMWWWWRRKTDDVGVFVGVLMIIFLLGAKCQM